MKTLYFITSNPGKLREAQIKLQPLHINVVQKNLGYPEIQADTLEEVARYGINDILKRFSHPFIIEDAGLFIDALQGFPGVYSKYVFFTIGLPGILKLLNQTEKRTAIFRSVCAYAVPHEKPQIFTGECKGVLTHEARGTGGFGYDPIFVPDGVSKTFAEMTIQEKNMFSHRSRALDKFVKHAHLQ